MSEESRDPDALLRRMAGQVVPVDDASRAEQRRERVVFALGRAIRQGGEQRLRSRRARRALGALGLALAIAAVVAVTVRVRGSAPPAPPPAGALVAEVSGSVLVTDGADSRVLRDGSNLTLRGSGEIETVADARADLRTQKSLVHLGAASKLLVPLPTPSEERYRLMLGKVDVSVDKDARSSRAVVVETPNVEVLVRGTVFAVGVAGQGGHAVTEVNVTRGSVWVLRNGAQVAVLGPGQHWSSESSEQPAPIAHDAAAAAAGTGAPSHPVVAEADARATRAEVAKAKSGTLAEENKMYQDALDARNRGDDARAAESFARLIARYPRSALGEEAAVERFRALKRMGQLSSAASEARRYLATHPLGFARDEARAIALSAANHEH